MRVCACTHTHTCTHALTHSCLEDACCQLLAWQTRTILVVYKHDPIPSRDTSQVQAHLCQVLEGLRVPFHSHPHATPTSLPCPKMHSECVGTKETSEMDNFTGCIQSCLDVFFFVSPVTEMLFFPLMYHRLSPLPNQPVGKDVYFVFPRHKLISGKCISDADSIFSGHTFEILVD